MLTIERLSLTLPPGFEHRAAAIAREVARHLAALPAGGQLARGSLRVEHSIQAADDGDGEIAAGIAAAVRRVVASGEAAGGGAV